MRGVMGGGGGGRGRTPRSGTCLNASGHGQRWRRRSPPDSLRSWLLFTRQPPAVPRSLPAGRQLQRRNNRGSGLWSRGVSVSAGLQRERAALSKSGCRVLQSHRKEQREPLRLQSVAPLPASGILAQHLRRAELRCSTASTCTCVWGVTAGRQKWAQAYPSLPFPCLFAISTHFLSFIPHTSFLDNLSSNARQPVLGAESEYTRRGFAGSGEYRLPPANHLDITVFSRLSAFWRTAVVPCVSSPWVRPALVSHVDLLVPDPHILLPFGASLAPHSIGLSHEFCMKCLQMASRFTF